MLLNQIDGQKGQRWRSLSWHMIFTRSETGSETGCRPV